MREGAPWFGGKVVGVHVSPWADRVAPAFRARLAKATSLNRLGGGSGRRPFAPATMARA